MDPIYHRRHRIKFFKSMVQEQEIMPLLHVQQIEDVSRIYQYQKRLLNVQKQKPNSNYQPKEEQEVQIELSAEQRVDQYKRTQNQKNISHKMRTFQGKDKKSTPAAYFSPLRSIAKGIQNHSRLENSSAYMFQIRQSEEELHFVKCNPGRKRRIVSAAVPGFARKRILSLENGLPLQLGNVFPTLDEKLDQMKPPPLPPKLSLVETVQRDMNNYISQPQNKGGPNQNPNYLLYEKAKEIKLMNRAKKNMNRSVDTAKRMMTTMNGYYSMKRGLKDEYSELVQTWKADRPRTHQLRTRNYKIGLINESRNQNMLDVFRKTSQNIRSNDLQKSKIFYNQLLDFVLSRTRNMDSHPLTKAICDYIRQELEINLKLDTLFLTDVISQIEGSELADDLIDEVILRIQSFLKSCE